MEKIDELIEAIAAVRLPNVFNPWRDLDLYDATNGYGAELRRLRLAKHFDCEPRFLLIGEAPGYQGCRFTGVPFTAEKNLIANDVPRVTIIDRITDRPRPYSEPSATVVWGILHELGIAADVVMWNAFAWHPHEPGKAHSNRTPTRDELIAGSNILRRVVEHFKDAKIIAVGKKSRHLLEWLGIWGSTCVRHPSMGGANEFREGMRKLIGTPTPAAESA